jgi:integrase
MDLRWGQVELKMFPVINKTGVIEPPNEFNDAGEEIELVNANTTVYLSILTGKTAKHKGGRLALGYLNTVKALRRIADRNYGLSIKEVIAKHSDDYIFRFKEFQSKRNGKLSNEIRFVEPTSFVKLFRTYLSEHGLLVDPVTKKERQPYSLRHTYATIRLLHDKVSPQVLIKQMGTSLQMLEKHYDHIDTIKSAHQLRDDESRQLIEADKVVDKKYEYREVKKSKN